MRASQSIHSKGVETRERILARALRVASSVGLSAITVGELAQELGLSKSGLFAHFKSKERLQLEILDTAAEHFRQTVFLPALSRPRGLSRLQAIFDNWLAWVSSSDLPGGCVFLAAALEWDDREGAVRERLVQWFEALERALTRAVNLAVDCADFRADLDTSQFAYELHAIVIKYHLDARLLRHESARTRAGVAFGQLVRNATASQPIDSQETNHA